MDCTKRYLQALLLLILVAALASCKIENGGSMEGGKGDQGAAAPDGQASKAAPATMKQQAQSGLEQALTRFRQIQSQGGFPKVPGGGALKVGQSSERVPALRKFLIATGDLPASADTARGAMYTQQLAEAVGHFQQRRGMKPDGVLGQGTLSAMNVSVDERISQMETSLTALQKLPDTLGGRFLLVNIPEFALHIYENGKQTGQMRVIVGEDYDNKQTPQLTEEMESVVFSPYWNVPDSIAAHEIVPKATHSKSYLSDNDFEIVSAWGPDAKPMEPTSANPERVASGDLKIRQKPGDDNSLGRVKFVLPNSEAIYLHGTPEDHLFAEETRAFSHGCIRVERPVDLAAWVLQGQPEWTRQRIEQAMQTDRQEQVKLNQSIPVVITYMTAFVDDKGQVQFRDDIYHLYDGKAGEGDIALKEQAQ